ncbi:protein ACCELERATED CELL DEATH 6-like [Aegilops tauschii subsp. strangulata]|uniref:PGG domain-containing protein n=2 Tax=Aegilops tauschii TaxID=37682 RepID=A0A453QCI3_AEGTS|nr:protein ACCELERATED CELL DEATH 6-like [Aegilops tauschii subsp. strangulata]
MDPASNVQSMSNELLMAAGQGDVEQIKRLLQQHEEEVVLHVKNEAEDAVDGQAGRAAAAAAMAVDADAATATGDSILHVVAGGGDAIFLECATVIVGKAKHLLGTRNRNRNGDTPLHCAARLGHARMVTHLLGLARPGDGDETGLKEILRAQNGKGETVLHEAIRLEDKDMVGVLLSADSQLARVPLADGASPLYLALLLGLGDIARQLFEGDQELSYSGPDGQNAFHAAILGRQAKEATHQVMKMLLERNNHLVTQADRSTGSTPLHLAATWRGPMGLLLKAGPAAAYMPDNNGSFPIHLAAFEGDKNSVSALLEESGPYCAKLRDGEGRTFLHVAAEEERSIRVIKLACGWQGKSFASSVMNMQDKDGNTALHLAVLAGNIGAVCNLVSIPQVKLDVRNNKRKTPLEIAFMTATLRAHSAGSAFYGDPRQRIRILLKGAHMSTGVSARIAFSGIERREIIKSALEEINRSQNIATETQIIGLVSVLITTVTFAAAFAVPGGYRADDNHKGGTPTLSGHYSFDSFVIANTLAFICSVLSILFLMYAGVGPNVKDRMWPLLMSVNFLASSARSLAAAFAFGVYSILAPVEQTKAMYSSMTMVLPLVLVELFLFIVAVQMFYSDGKAVMARMFASQASWWRLAHAGLTLLMGLVGLFVIGQYWPYILIAAMSH